MGTFASPRFEGSVQRRVVGWWLLLLVVGIPIFSLLCVLATVVVAQIPSNGLARMAVALVLGMLAAACIRVISRSVMKKMRQAWLARGVPAELDFTFSLCPEGLQVASDVGVAMMRWAFINEVMLVRGHWLLISAGYGFGIPRQSFRSKADERAFMTTLFDYLEPSAGTRSRKAKNMIASL